MSELQFETLKIDNDYEIAVNHYPYIIRRKSNHRIVKECDNTGYRRLTLNGKKYYVHVIVAKQWIENDNPESKTQVDHINHDRTDNRLENLRWITPSGNQYNKTSYAGNTFEYLEELSDLAFELLYYNEHDFENIWFEPDGDCFYYYTGTQYREIHYCERDTGALYIQIRDAKNVRTTINLNKFKKHFELI